MNNAYILEEEKSLMEKQHHKNCVLKRKNNWQGYNILIFFQSNADAIYVKKNNNGRIGDDDNHVINNLSPSERVMTDVFYFR